MFNEHLDPPEPRIPFGARICWSCTERAAIDGECLICGVSQACAECGEQLTGWKTTVPGQCPTPEMHDEGARK